MRNCRSLNLRAIENCICGLRSIERNMRFILRTVYSTWDAGKIVNHTKVLIRIITPARAKGGIGNAPDNGNKKVIMDVSIYWRKHARDLRINTATHRREDKVRDCGIFAGPEGVHKVRFEVV
jgi:hypothetical protein